MRVCKHCGSSDLYRKRGLICRPCYNGKDRERRAERRKAPGVREAELRTSRERYRERYATDPEFRERKLKATQKRRLFYADGDLSEAQWQAVTELYGGLCAYCLAPASTLDHVDPIAHGGSHTAANVVPACEGCNSSKGDSLLITWGGRS